MSKQIDALKLALEAFKFDDLPLTQQNVDAWDDIRSKAITAIKEALAQQSNEQKKCDNCGEFGQCCQQSNEQVEPVAWISVKDALPKAVRGLSYKKSITDTVLVRHSDRPDYPITAHAVLGEGLGAGISILTEGASEYPEIAWYSASSDLNNPFGLRNDNYERYLPRIFGSKITHWMPITHPPVPTAQPKPLTDKAIDFIWDNSNPTNFEARSFARAIEAAHGIKE